MSWALRRSVKAPRTYFTLYISDLALGLVLSGHAVAYKHQTRILGGIRWAATYDGMTDLFWEIL